jgi:peptidoglycan/LPS O-acetylase OafA/YrhL
VASAPLAPASTGGRIHWLDGWRGLAILGVLAGHFASPYVPALAVLGGYGVEFFFVLSGRLMAEILFVNRHPLPDFFRRRFARVFPALFVYATAMALTAVTAWAALGIVAMRPWEYFTAITFTVNYVQAFGGEESVTLAHIWSLAVEEHSYAILAVLAVLVARSAGKAKWLLLAAGLLALLNGIRLYEADAGGVHEIYWRTDVRIAPVFLSGAVYLFCHAARPSAQLAAVLGHLPLVLLPASIALFFQPSITLAYTASAILLALSVNLLKFGPGWALRALSVRFLTMFGLLSYSIYLWQQPFARLAISQGWPPLPLLAGAVACGVASFLVIERPARAWINGWNLGLRPKPEAIGA